MPLSQSLSVPQKIAVTLLLALILWLPRGLMLNHFVAVDERSWLTRSGNFFLALSQGDFASTFQRYHPGVTTMWLGMAGYLWRYPAYAQDAADQIGDMSEGVEGFLRAQGREPIDLLAAGRTFVVLATLAALLIAFWVAADLFGLLAALAGFLLLAFEPFLLGLTRMLHVDGLSSAFMFLSLLTFLRYHAGSPFARPAGAGRLRDLVISAVAAGLAWLTKSPALFLIPFMGTITLYAVYQRWRADRGAGWRYVLRPAFDGLAWLGIGAFVFVLLWPAMWVQPIESLRAIFSAAGDSAAEGHSKALFYNGRAYAGDPGPWFYPHTFLWRASPVMLIGLALALAGWIGRRRPLDSPERRGVLAWLILFVLLFTLFMTLGAKKFPRYLLPVYMPLDLTAGIGWTVLALWAGSRLHRHWVAPLLIGVMLIAQALIALPTFPYYFTYYNPLLGGAKRAPQVMMIGLGEGMDEAARYLRALPGAENDVVASWYRGGSFNYFYPYESVDIDQFFRSDHAVLYAHQWQREVPDKRLLDYFAALAPEHIVTINGTEYARIYDLSEAPPPAYFTDWATGPERTATIRLVSHDILPETVEAGEPFVVRLHIYSLRDLDRNLNVLVRLLDQNGQEIARSEGWPFGTPTSTWQPGQVYIDGHEFTLPPDTPPGYVRVEVGFYDPATQEVITPVVASDGSPLPDLLAVDYVTVGPLASGSPVAFEEPVHLGDQILLTAAEIDGQAATQPGAVTVSAAAGASVPLTLYWRMQQYVPADYTVLLQLLGPDGQIAAQWDGPPVGGLLPTSLWRSEGEIVDGHTLEMPVDLQPGEYRLITGLYDLATLERLPVTIGGGPAGDTVPIATLSITAAP